MVQENNVKFLRLTSGEDIISEISEIDYNLVLTNPLKILYTSASPGILSISLMQWVFPRISDNQTFEMPKNTVIISSEPSANLTEYYWNTIEHFAKKQMEKSVSFDEDYQDQMDEYDDVIEATGGEEGLEMLKELLNTIKGDKRKLH